MTGFSDAVLVEGSTTQTAGLDPAAINAVHGNAICATGFHLAVPATALPSVIASGGFSIVTLTRMVALFGLIAGETSLTRPVAFTFGIRNERQRYWASIEVGEENCFVDLEYSVALTVLSEAEYRLTRLHHLADLKTARCDHTRCTGAQLGIAKGIFRRAQLRLRRFEGAFCGSQSFLRLIERHTRRETV